jgi:hypothetical protein
MCLLVWRQNCAHIQSVGADAVLPQVPSAVVASQVPSEDVVVNVDVALDHDDDVGQDATLNDSFTPRSSTRI